jgi:hypothetical protein
VHLVVWRDLGAALPGAVNQVNQSLELLFRTFAVFDVAGSHLISMESHVMATLLPGQGIGFGQIDGSAQGGIEVR